MTTLFVEMQADDIITNNKGDGLLFGAEGASYDGEATVRISNPDRENGYGEEVGPLSFLNSARITTQPEDDAIHLLVSIGDPRGAFCVTFRRKPNGTVLIHLPTPGEGMAHLETRELHPGTLEIGSLHPSEMDGESWTPTDFSDPEPEENDE